MDRLFLITPLSETETEEGLNAMRAAQNAGVQRALLQHGVYPQPIARAWKS